jgi:hypothetical protein
LPVVWYGFEIWYLALREEHRLKEFEDMVPKRIFGSKRDKMTGEWSNLHNEVLHNWFYLPNRMVKPRGKEDQTSRV